MFLLEIIRLFNLYQTKERFFCPYCSCNHYHSLVSY